MKTKVLLMFKFNSSTSKVCLVDLHLILILYRSRFSVAERDYLRFFSINFQNYDGESLRGIRRSYFFQLRLLVYFRESFPRISIESLLYEKLMKNYLTALDSVEKQPLELCQTGPYIHTTTTLLLPRQNESLKWPRPAFPFHPPLLEFVLQIR